jgi:hypothetical protein
MSAQASASRSVSLATAAEQVYAAIVDPDRYGVWCTLHRSWSQRPEHLDDTATSAETIAILDRPTEITWAVDPKAGPSTVIRHGEGPRNLRATMSLTAEAADGGTTVTFAAEFSSPAFDDDLASAIAQWTDAALVLSLARLQDVASGAAPRESVEVGADTETFLDGLGFTECPRWRDGCLYLVDMVQHLVLRVEIDGSVTTLATVEATPGGLGWLPDGTLLVVSQRDGKILRIGGSGELTVHADLSAQITSPLNDMWVGPDGRAYVGEMGFDVHAVIQQTGGPGARRLRAARRRRRQLPQRHHAQRRRKDAVCRRVAGLADHRVRRRRRRAPGRAADPRRTALCSRRHSRRSRWLRVVRHSGWEADPSCRAGRHRRRRGAHAAGQYRGGPGWR